MYQRFESVWHFVTFCDISKCHNVTLLNFVIIHNSDSRYVSLLVFLAIPKMWHKHGKEKETTLQLQEDVSTFVRYMCLQDTCVYEIHVSTSVRCMCLQDTCVYEIHVSAFVRFTCKILSMYHTDIPTRPDPQSWDICITFERYVYNMHIYMYLTNVNTCISRIWRLDPSEIKCLSSGFRD